MDIGYLLMLWMHTLRLTRPKSNLLPKDTGRPSLNYLFVAAKLVEYRTRVRYLKAFVAFVKSIFMNAVRNI